ncbi:MAG: hypothetical protein EBT07_09695 [Actinobacteria bacterium]|nr:hypothetical protein [Actinomycetota bacterium]
MKVSFSVVLPSGWKVSYLPFGRRGGIPLMLASPESVRGASQKNIDEKLEQMKKAEVIEVNTEVLPKGNHE